MTNFLHLGFRSTHIIIMVVAGTYSKGLDQQHRFVKQNLAAPAPVVTMPNKRTIWSCLCQAYNYNMERRVESQSRKRVIKSGVLLSIGSDNRIFNLQEKSRH